MIQRIKATAMDPRDPGVYFTKQEGPRLELVCYANADMLHSPNGQLVDPSVVPFARIVPARCYAVGNADQEFHVDVGVCGYEDGRIILVNDRTGLETTLRQDEYAAMTSGQAVHINAGCDASNSAGSGHGPALITIVGISLLLTYLYNRFRKKM